MNLEGSIIMRIARSTALAIGACLFLAPAAWASPRILVVSTGEARLKVFDGATYELLYSVKVPGKPHEVAVSRDGRLAFVADYEGLDNSVSIIDLEKRERVTGVNLKPSYRPHGMAVTRNNQSLFVTCEASRAVLELDIASHKVTRTISLRDDGVHMLILSPDEKWLYATSPVAGTVSIVDVAAGKLERTVLSGSGCEGIAITPDGKEIWSVNRVLQTIAVIQTAANKKEMTMPAVGNPIRIHFTGDASLALVSCGLSNDIAVFDRAARKEVGRVAVGEFPLGIEITPDGKRWLVTNHRSASVSVIDAASRTQTESFAVGLDPEGILYLE